MRILPRLLLIVPFIFLGCGDESKAGKNQKIDYPQLEEPFSGREYTGVVEGLRSQRFYLKIERNRKTEEAIRARITTHGYRLELADTDCEAGIDTLLYKSGDEERRFNIGEDSRGYFELASKIVASLERHRHEGEHSTRVNVACPDSGCDGKVYTGKYIPALEDSLEIGALHIHRSGERVKSAKIATFKEEWKEGEDGPDYEIVDIERFWIEDTDRENGFDTVIIYPRRGDLFRKPTILRTGDKDFELYNGMGTRLIGILEKPENEVEKK